VGLWEEFRLEFVRKEVLGREDLSTLYLMDGKMTQIAFDGPASSQEVRCAVRFPLTLPVVISAGRSEYSALTSNVSASGVLFEMNSPLKVGEGIDFSLRMPGAILGTPNDVLVHCHGRVVRCSVSQSQSQVAATIDEYTFVEQ
jgi:PilZ domain